MMKEAPMTPTKERMLEFMDDVAEIFTDPLDTRIREAIRTLIESVDNGPGPAKTPSALGVGGSTPPPGSSHSSLMTCPQCNAAIMVYRKSAGFEKITVTCPNCTLMFDATFVGKGLSPDDLRPSPGSSEVEEAFRKVEDCLRVYYTMEHCVVWPKAEMDEALTVLRKAAQKTVTREWIKNRVPALLEVSDKLEAEEFIEKMLNELGIEVEP